MAATGTGAVATSLIGGFPTIVPASVLGAGAPSKRVNIGAIGTGPISRTHDLPGLWKHDAGRIVAVCDLDSRRVADAKTLVNGHYARQSGKPHDRVTTYADYRRLLANKDIARWSSARRITRRKLFWDPRLVRFRNDDEANAMLSRPQRWPYAIDDGRVSS